MGCVPIILLLLLLPVIREVASRLNKDRNITWFQVGCENIESIHNHSAYAFVEVDKRGRKG